MKGPITHRWSYIFRELSSSLLASVWLNLLIWHTYGSTAHSMSASCVVPGCESVSGTLVYPSRPLLSMHAHALKRSCSSMMGMWTACCLNFATRYTYWITFWITPFPHSQVHTQACEYSCIRAEGAFCIHMSHPSPPCYSHSFVELCLWVVLYILCNHV